MIINYTNRELIKDIYLHDGIFNNFHYDYVKKELRLDVRQIISTPQDIIADKFFAFKFFNIIYFNVKGCEFWGESNQISCIYLEENETKLEELKSEMEQNYESYKFTLLDKNIDFFTIGFEMISGDYITIICENIDYKEIDLLKLSEKQKTD